MKRLLVVIVFTVFAISGVFAIGMSGGAGGSVSSTWWKFSATSGGTSGSIKDAIVPFGAKLFFDATYVQVSAGYIMATTVTQTISSGGSTATASTANNLSYLTFAALGKYPFTLGPVTVFPLVGVEYDLNVSHPSTDYFEGGLPITPTNSDYNQFWLKGGAGVDVAVSGNFYVRTEGLYGYKMLNSDEKSVVTSAQSGGATNVSLIFSTFDLSVLVGYKF